MKKTDIKKRTRYELMRELAKHAHPSWYKNLLGWKTEHLEKLLAHFQTGGKVIVATPVAVILVQTKAVGPMKIEVKAEPLYGPEPLKNKQKF